MLEYFEGTVFNAPVKTYVNAVNCVGIMGAGIALEFKLRFPDMYDDYVNKCKQNKLKIGKPYIYKHSSDIWIMNFPTKNHWKYPSKIEWIEKGLEYFKVNYKKWGVDSIAFPKLGTANGKLDWLEVRVMMEKYLKDLDIDVYICLDEKEEAEGIEKIMIDSINDSSIDYLVNNVKINRRQAQAVSSNLPMDRFWHISKIKGIGIKTYEKLFSYYYGKALELKGKKELPAKINTYEQLTFIND